MTVLPQLTTDDMEFSSYAYSYPHKSSYRTLSPPVLIADAWRDEDVRQLSLYVHIPFCEMRCGFCNLFTQSQPQGDVVRAYLSTLGRQFRVVRNAVPGARFSQFAIGGGTPTFLEAPQLESLLLTVESNFQQSISELPTSIETSPATATLDRLKVLKEFGVQRVSVGIQSFVEDEIRQIGRPQRADDVFASLDRIRRMGFPALNVDLIYGHPLQTHRSWKASLLAALRFEPDELYLYPLYIRPQTGLGVRRDEAPPHRDDLYRLARDLLLSLGYVQSSLRCFRRPTLTSPSTYSCQRDGMIGLGCGARSYTQRLHYATRFAVTQAGVRAILRSWISQTDAELALATHGMWLSAEEQIRRHVIMSLLQADGLQLSEMQQRFPPQMLEELPEMAVLFERGWAERLQDRIRLTPEGLAKSDIVGPLLYSSEVRDRLREFTQLRTIKPVNS